MLRAKNTHTTAGLLSAIHNCTKEHEIGVEELEGVADYKSLVEPFVEKFHDHTGKGSPLHFRFYAVVNDAGERQVHFQSKHVAHEEWVPASGEKVLDRSPNFDDLRSANRRPLAKKHVEDLTKMVTACRGHFSTAEKEWWSMTLDAKKQEEVACQGLEVPGVLVQQNLFPSVEHPVAQVPAEFLPTETEVAQELRELSYALGDPVPKEVYVGRRQSRLARNTRGIDMSKLKEGSMVALRSEAVESSPFQIAKTVTIDYRKQTVDVQWFQPFPTKAGAVRYHPMYVAAAARTLGKSKRGGNLLPHVDPVSFASVLLFAFPLVGVSKNGAGRLAAKTLEEIKLQLSRTTRGGLEGGGVEEGGGGSDISSNSDSEQSEIVSSDKVGGGEDGVDEDED